MGNSKKYPYTTTDSFLEFWGQGGFFELEFWRPWGSTYIWNSEGLKMLILWALPVRKWSTTERRDTDDDRESAGYRRSIRSIWHVLKKADKTWVVHQIHEFLDDEYQINKIRTDLCSRMNILEHAFVGSWRTAKTESPVFSGRELH